MTTQQQIVEEIGLAVRDACEYWLRDLQIATEPFVPVDTGMLRDSWRLETTADGFQLVYDTDYAEIINKSVSYIDQGQVAMSKSLAEYIGGEIQERLSSLAVKGFE